MFSATNLAARTLVDVVTAFSLLADGKASPLRISGTTPILWVGSPSQPRARS